MALIYVAGDQLVGKDNLCLKFVTGKFSDRNIVQIGHYIYDMKYCINDKEISIRFWKSPGFRMYPSGLRSVMYPYEMGPKRVHCCLLVYDLTKRKSFEALDEILELFNKYIIASNIILVGAKSDLKEERVVTAEEAKEWCQKNGNMLYIEVSAKDGTNCDYLLNLVAEKSLIAYEKSRIKDYLVLKELGSGTFGNVSLVNQGDNTFAIKMLKKEFFESLPKEFLEREEKILQQIAEHPHIVKYYESFIFDNNYYIVLEYCNGADLSKFIEKKITKNETLPSSEVTDKVYQISSALEVLHDKYKIAHRDLKPANILINDKGSLKITDFGLSKKLNWFSWKHSVVGTPAYMAPEQFYGKYDFSADIWSLGVIFMELAHVPEKIEYMEIKMQKNIMLPSNYDEKVKLCFTGRLSPLKSLLVDVILHSLIVT